jgi:hypothetical protein
MEKDEEKKKRKMENDLKKVERLKKTKQQGISSYKFSYVIK